MKISSFLVQKSLFTSIKTITSASTSNANAVAVAKKPSTKASESTVVETVDLDDDFKEVIPPISVATVKKQPVLSVRPKTIKSPLNKPNKSPLIKPRNKLKSSSPLNTPKKKLKCSPTQPKLTKASRSISPIETVDLDDDFKEIIPATPETTVKKQAVLSVRLKTKKSPLKTPNKKLKCSSTHTKLAKASGSLSPLGIHQKTNLKTITPVEKLLFKPLTISPEKKRLEIQPILKTNELDTSNEENHPYNSDNSEDIIPPTPDRASPNKSKRVILKLNTKRSELAKQTLKSTSEAGKPEGKRNATSEMDIFNSYKRPCEEQVANYEFEMPKELNKIVEKAASMEVLGADSNLSLIKRHSVSKNDDKLDDIADENTPPNIKPKLTPGSFNRKSTENEIDFWLDSDLDLSGFSFKDESLPMVVKETENSMLLEGSHKRYNVTSVEMTIAGEKLLKLTQIDKQNQAISTVKRTCLLKGFWAETNINENDIVHIFAPFRNGQSIVDNTQGLIVVNPDTLISSTSIVSTLFCHRKAVLADRFKGLDQGNKYMLIGCLVHELFQEFVDKDTVSIALMQLSLSKAISKINYLHDLILKRLDATEMSSSVEKYLPYIYDWIQKYKAPTCSPLLGDNSDVKAQVTSILDIEDNLWCPTYGIKGKIDVTVDVKIHKGKRVESKVVPLELKTGKASFSVEHQGQLTLYAMMMSQRAKDPEAGLLLYLSEGPQMKLIETTYASQSGLIQLRNELMSYLEKKEGPEVFPDPISRCETCQKCPYVVPCSLTEVTIESKEITRSDKRKKLVEETLKHLNGNHVTYFEHWYKLLQLELITSSKRHGCLAFWNYSSVSREKKGMCFSNMTLAKSTWDEKTELAWHVFRSEGKTKSLKLIGLQMHDTVVISSEKIETDLAICMGSIMEMTDDTITVTLDKDLCKRKNWENDSFRLDKHITTSFTAINFKNVVDLMSEGDRANKLRKLVIDLVEPTYSKCLKREMALEVKPIVKLLNNNQQRAIFKALMAEDYVLIQGMPGTGKTSTIVALVRLLVILGKSVLLTSYTHSAVDNILLKLKTHDIPFIRLGKAARVHPEIKEFTADAQTENITTVEELKKFYNTAPIIATTCLGINHPVFKLRQFDFCIVDEGSQVLQPTCLGPLLLANTFVLVGDSKQLPPLAQSSKAKSQGFCESLFSRLESPTSVMELTIQYRMNNEIMRLCNELTYQGKLECGNDDIAKATLQLKIGQETNDIISDWMKPVLSPELSHSVVFLDTRNCSAFENDANGGIANSKEAQIVEILIAELLKRHELLENGIGIISPYRNQVNLIKQSLVDSYPNIEVNTVDQYQGRDKSVIIFSCVRSNSNEEAMGDILQDENRLNVAITRAKHKLVIVGNTATLNKYKPFQRLIGALKNAQIVLLPELDI